MGTIATFGSKVFQVDPDKIYTFNGFAYNTALQIEKQDADGTKPSSYLKGVDLDTISLTIKLDAANGVNPRNEWGEWKKILEAQATHQFILGGVPIGDTNFLLKSVAVSNANIESTGKILALDLALEFEEYIRAGKKKEKESSKATTSVPGLYTMLDSSTYGDLDNLNLKRNNPDMEAQAIEGAWEDDV